MIKFRVKYVKNRQHAHRFNSISKIFLKKVIYIDFNMGSGKLKSILAGGLRRTPEGTMYGVQGPKNIIFNHLVAIKNK